jgi:hypothetical protein
MRLRSQAMIGHADEPALLTINVDHFVIVQDALWRLSGNHKWHLP